MIYRWSYHPTLKGMAGKLAATADLGGNHLPGSPPPPALARCTASGTTRRRTHGQAVRRGRPGRRDWTYSRHTTEVLMSFRVHEIVPETVRGHIPAKASRQPHLINDATPLCAMR